MTITVTSDTEKAVMEAIAQKINQGPNSDGFILLADDLTATYAHPDITGVAINYSN